ncbi:MAG TPA: cation diffusion facilitator family transporter [Polyangiales bacterium]|nr:cation diffusion facilitator family transporter [Polyangiales bacterium]
MVHDGAHAGHAHGNGGPARHSHGSAHAGHSHGGRGHSHGGGVSSQRLLAVTLCLTLGYAVVEAVMGFVTGSLSLLADAGHMITDSGALALSLVVARIALRPRSASKTYGYRRAEVMGALANAVAMLVISGVILVEAVQRMSSPRTIDGHGLFYTALGGLLVNVIAAALLSRGAGDLNVRSALLHVVADALGSVGAIVAGLCVTWFGFMLADPLASLAIALVIGAGSLRLLREASDVLMEGAPTDLDIRALERTILDTPGVRAVHDLHVWCLTPREPMLTAHVVHIQSAHGTDVAKRVGERLRAAHGLEHVTIQPEPPAPELVPLRIPGREKKL